MEKRAKTQFWIELWSDLVCIVCANILAYLLFYYVFDKILNYSGTEWFRFGTTLTVSSLLPFVGFHKNINVHKRSKSNEFISVVINVTFTYLIFIALIALTKNPIIESRYILAFGFLFTILFSAVSRYVTKRWITNHFTRSKNASIVGIITTKDIAENFVSSLTDDWTLKISGIGIINDLDFSDIHNAQLDILTPRTVGTSICDVPVIAKNQQEFLNWVRCAPIDEVYINLPYKAASEVQFLIEELEDMGITVHINIPSLEKIIDESKFNNINCKMVSGYPMATFAASVIESNWVIIKRLIDIVLGLLGCILSAPIILITAIPLLIESPGPLIFKQQRVGKNGRLFNIYKLRSMYVDAEERKAALMQANKMDGLMFKVDNDPRITKVGKFIRKCSIDELPQFFNVVKGDMSLIGTRPPTIDEFEQYESHHKRRLSMRPGITGMWQVSGRSNIQSFEEIVKLDCEYIDNWSPLLDIKIFFKTVIVVLNHNGAE